MTKYLLEMKTIELTIATIGTGILYGSYVYYLMEMGRDVPPTNLWFHIGRGIDDFFFNGGVKPKEQIEDAPGKIEEYINNN